MYSRSQSCLHTAVYECINAFCFTGQPVKTFAYVDIAASEKSLKQCKHTDVVWHCVFVAVTSLHPQNAMLQELMLSILALLLWFHFGSFKVQQKKMTKVTTCVKQ